MKNSILPLSLLIGAALTIPSLAMAAPAKSKSVTPKTVVADAVADSTLQTTAENTDGKLALNQASAVEITETKTFSRSRASVNNQNSSQAAATGNVEADEADIETIQNPQEELQEEMADPQEDMVDSQEVM